MSKKKHYKPKNQPKQLMNTDSERSMIEDMFGDPCYPSVCPDINGNWREEHKGVDRIEYLLKILPGINYVVGHLVNYIFSNGITTGSSVSDESLDNWMYRKNGVGATNYEVLREAVRYASIYGECGIRWYEDNIYTVKPGYYALLTLTEEGITKIVGYMVRDDGDKVAEDIVVKSRSVFEEAMSAEDVDIYLKSQHMILLTDEDFAHIRNDTGHLHGLSPLESDRQRVDLLVNTYKQLNYDITNDGVGRLLLWMKQGYISGESEVSTTEVINQTPHARDERFKKAVNDAAYVGKSLKESGVNSVTVLSNAFSKADRLDRVTKATEFFDWISQEIEIEAQMFDIPPVLVGAGHLYGNISLQAVIDNDVINIIIPKREAYAVQFSPMICSHLGFTKIYFDKYDLLQAEDINDTRIKVSEMIRNLASANKNSPSEDLEKLISDLSTVLDASLFDDSGELDAL